MKRFILNLICPLWISSALVAQTWTGNVSSNWNMDQNWSPASIPLSGSNVVIPGTISGTHWPVLPGDLTINAINMGAGSRIDFAGHSLTLKGISAYQNFIGATLNNSVPANKIVVNMQGGDGGWTRVFRSNSINGNIVFNISGPANFQEADAASSANQYNGNVTYNIATAAPFYLCSASKSVFGGHLTVNRTVAGYTNAFNAGASIAGNFSFTNLAGGEAFFGSVSNRTTIGGTIDMQVDYPALSNFKIHRLINQTTGGTLQIQNTAGFEMLNDTLLLGQLSVTGYRGGYGVIYNNSINGNITIADHATNSNGWTTLMRSNVFTGNTSVTINGINTFLEADQPGSGNLFNGNTSFVSNQSAILYISNGAKSTYNGNLSISRGNAGTTTAFIAGASITGNFYFQNNFGGATSLGHISNKTLVGGILQVTANYTTAGQFLIHHMVNQTNGGSINLQNTTGFSLKNDTLKLLQLSITGYKFEYGQLHENEITGEVIIADDPSNSNGWSTTVRSNHIIGNSSFTNNGINALLEADVGHSANTYDGNTNFTANNSGDLRLSWADTSQHNGNLSVSRTSAGLSWLFAAGSDITGNFIYTNHAGGETHIGNQNTRTVYIAGTITIDAVYAIYSAFTLHKVLNTLPGGSITIKNTIGIEMIRDTLNVNSITLKGMKNGYSNILNNLIIGNVTMADDSASAGGWGLFLRSNQIQGISNFTTNSVNTLFEGDAGSSFNVFNGNTVFRATQGGGLYISTASASTYNGDLLIERLAPGEIFAFNAGADINGNLSIVNNTSGSTLLGNTLNRNTNISGTLNISTSYSTLGSFRAYRLVNHTPGGSILVKNCAGFDYIRDTVLVTDISITKYKNGYGSFISNKIVGNVLLADDSTNASGWSTYIRSNTITGQCSFINNGVNAFLEADAVGSSNVFDGNTTFMATQSGALIICDGEPSLYKAYLGIERLQAGYTKAFNAGAYILGNFAYTNNRGGATQLGNKTTRSTLISGMVNIAAHYAAPDGFVMYRLVNQTNGGNISIQNTIGIDIFRDTLLVNSMQVNGYKNGYGYFIECSITGDLSWADDPANASGWTTYIRNNRIAGNTIINNRGGNAFLDADEAGRRNQYLGSLSYYRTGAGVIVAANADTNIIKGNLTLNSAAGIALGHLRFVDADTSSIEQLGTQPVSLLDLIVAKSASGKIILLDSLTITGKLIFAGGIIQNAAGAELILTDNAQSIGESNQSHATGPVVKIGNDAFTFPVGSAAGLQAVSMTAPSNVTDRFMCTYVAASPHPWYDTAARAPSIARVGTCEYWNIQRMAGTSNVKFTFDYGLPCQYVYEPDKLLITRYTGSQWEDLGNGGTTSNNGNGTITTTANSTAFGIFALGTKLTVAPAIAIASSVANPVCVCAKVTFTATPAYEGFTPAYQWRKNGTVVGTNSPVYTDSSLATNDNLSCTLYSSAAYANPPVVTSNSIVIQITYTNTWTGGVSSDWNNPANWSCNSVPCDTTQVVINSGVTHDPELPGDTIITVDKIEAKSGSKMTIKPNGKLIIKGKKN